MYLRALFADKLLLDTLTKNHCQGYIHSIFAHAVNMKIEDNEIFSLLSREGDSGPHVIVVDIQSFKEVEIHKKEPVWTDEDMLHLGHVTVDLHSIQIWEQEKIVYPQNTSVLEQNIAWMHSCVLVPGPLDETPFSQNCRSILCSHTQSIVSSLSKGDMKNAKACAAALLGLGTGLTPTGDDILLGLILTCTIKDSPTKIYRSMFAELVEQAESATHCLSCAGMKHALRGMCRSSLTAFIKSLMYETEDDCKRQLLPVLEIGSSSGTDIAYGILHGFQICLTMPANTQSTLEKTTP